MMLEGDPRVSTGSISDSSGLSRRMRRVLRHIGFFVSTSITAVWRRGCLASVRRLCGLRAAAGAASHWTPFAGTRRRLSSSMEFLEQFRNGPETQSEWNLLLWRVTFPMIALVIFTLLAVLGKFGHRIYSFIVCPVWYFSQFVLVAHPFLLVFKFNESDLSIRKRIWQVLAVVSIAISAAEWFLSSPPDTSPSSYSRLGPSAAFSASIRARFLRHSWIVANTVFGIVALVAIPRYFYLQKRTVARDGNAAFDSREAASLRASPSATTLFIPLSPGLTATTPRSTSTGSHHHDPFQDDSFSLTPPVSTTPPSSSRGNANTSTNRPYSSVIVTSSASPSVTSTAATLAMIKHRTRAVFMLTASCAVLVWIAMFSSYSSIKAVEVISKYWFTVYLFSPIVCALLIYVLRGHTVTSLAAHASSSLSSTSFDFVAIYSVLIVHLPVFLGHLCFRLFTIIELADPAHPAHAEARGIEFAGAAGSGSGVNFSASTSWMKLGISIVYLLVMQTYFYAMTQVVNAMAEPFAHPSLLYLGQLYYYLFWYVLVGSDTPIDALYWGMLLVNNIHIAFLNTGIYADVKQTSVSCFSMPLFMGNANLFRGASMAMCFRATTLTMANVTASSAAVCRDAVSSGAGKPSRSKKNDRYDPTTRAGFTSGEDDGAAVDLFASSDVEDAEAGGQGTVYRASRRSRKSRSGSQGDHDVSDDLLSSEDPAQKALRLSSSTRASPWSAFLDVMPARSLFAFGAGASTSVATGAASAPSSSATIYFTQCPCGSSSGADPQSTTCTCSRSNNDHAASCGDASMPRSGAIASPPVQAAAPSVFKSSSSASTEQLRPLYFLMKLAEQDNMADTTALILVPSLLTLLAVLDKPSQGFSIIADQLNLWVRCVFMFAGRMGGAYLAREIFTYKLRSRLRQQSGVRGLSNRALEDAMQLNNHIEGVSTRLWIQRLMLQDFHRHFWYLTIVTIVVTFACFERMEVPARFALLT